MSAFLPLFAATLYLANAETAHFIGYHSTVQNAENPHVYPLDICSNTEVGTLGFSDSDYKFSIFSCNDAGTQVTETMYGSDGTCNDANISDSVVYSDNTLTPGTLYSFNCTGTANYMSYGTYRGVSTCCGTYDADGNRASLLALAAADVCIAWKFDSTGTVLYTKFTCDEDGNGARVAYSDSDCSVVIDNPSEIEPGSADNVYMTNGTCDYDQTIFSFDLYRTMDYCVIDGSTVFQNAFEQCYNYTATPAPTRDDGAANAAYLWASIAVFVACLWQM